MISHAVPPISVGRAHRQFLRVLVNVTTSMNTLRAGVCTPISKVDSVDTMIRRGGGTNNLMDVHFVLAIDLSAHNYALLSSSSVPL